jgi:hypothetical protein
MRSERFSSGGGWRPPFYLNESWVNSRCSFRWRHTFLFLPMLAVWKRTYPPWLHAQSYASQVFSVTGTWRTLCSPSPDALQRDCTKDTMRLPYVQEITYPWSNQKFFQLEEGAYLNLRGDRQSLSEREMLSGWVSELSWRGCNNHWLITKYFSW